MELSVDEKIKDAVAPLLERILALETENKHIKEEIAALHAASQPKTNHKPRNFCLIQLPKLLTQRDLKPPKTIKNSHSITR